MYIIHCILCLQDVRDFLGDQDDRCPRDDARAALEMKSFARQGSSASSDTYASCYTHQQSSPSNCDMTPDSLRHNVYVNPLEPDIPVQIPGPIYLTGAGGGNGGNALGGEQVASPSAAFPSSQRSPPPPSPKPRSSPKRSRSKDPAKGGSGASTLRQIFKNRKQKSLTLGKPRARLNDSDSGHSHSSSESINSQGSVKAVSRFRKPFGGRLHSSPSTGKKLANYHLIANSQSGKKHCNVHLAKPVTRLLSSESKFRR